MSTVQIWLGRQCRAAGLGALRALGNLSAALIGMAAGFDVGDWLWPHKVLAVTLGIWAGLTFYCLVAIVIPRGISHYRNNYWDDSRTMKIECIAMIIAAVLLPPLLMLTIGIVLLVPLLLLWLAIEFTRVMIWLVIVMMITSGIYVALVASYKIFKLGRRGIQSIRRR